MAVPVENGGRGSGPPTGCSPPSPLTSTPPTTPPVTSPSVTTPPVTTPVVSTPDPARLLNLGPQYIRNRYLKREPGIERRNRRSAVELLEESKSLYVKSESVLDNKQVLRPGEGHTARHRRSTYGAGAGVGGDPTTPGGERRSRGSTDSTSTPTSPTPSNTVSTTAPTAPLGSGGPAGGGSGGRPEGRTQEGGKDAGGVRSSEDSTARDQCHNITTSSPQPLPVKKVAEDQEGRGHSQTGGTQSVGSGREDQVDSGGTGGQVGEGTGGGIERVVLRKTTPPCPHGLPINRPCEQCLNANNNLPETTTDSPLPDPNSHQSRPPPPVPPKPSESYTQPQGGGGAGRQPPPVPPKRHSVVSENGPGVNNNSLFGGCVTGGSGGGKAPPPVPPKPGDRNSGCGGAVGSLRRQDSSGGKAGPPPVLPKPSSAGPILPPASQQQEQTPQQFWRNQNGMETDTGGVIASVRPKSAGSSIAAVAGDSPRSSSGGGIDRGCTTPPPPPPPVPPKPKPPLMSSAVEAWREAHTDTSSELDQRSAASSPHIHQKSTDDKLATSGCSGPVVRRRPQRKFHRSRSDLTKRFSNSSDLSELSARFSRNSADLERFFNEMGLDRSVLEPMMLSACQRSASDLHLFESASSLESPDVRSWGSEDDGEHPLKHEAVEERTPQGGQTSIVERNARIIKWLCSVKKAASHEEPLTEQ